MESYGTELKETPYPLIAALGARELQIKVLQLVRTINEEFVPKLHFTSMPSDHRFPLKKEIREKHGTFPNQTQRDFDGYRTQGILKTRWMKKHHELLPAVVLLFHEFDPRWNQKDWMAHETAMRDEMDQLKRGLSGRECRVVLILVQQIDDVGVAPVSVTDERLASLRKRLETDSKGLLLLRARDITRGSSVLAKLESSVRTYALEYYKAQSKRVKKYKKALSKTSHQLLHVRYSFKIAHYYEFRRYTTKVLQHYETAYRAITALPLLDNERIEGVVTMTQVKTMAEYINFKLCYHLMFSSSNIKAAVEQLQRHMKVYSRALGPGDRANEHWEWVSRQYHVFAQLLSEAVSIRGSLPATGLDSDIYKEPYLYYSIAAKYATSRRKAATKLGLSVAGNRPTAESVVSEFVVVPSIYIGGDPVVSETQTSGQELSPAEALVKYRRAIERTVPHARRTIHLLEHAIQHLSIYIGDQKTPRTRLKSRLLAHLGIERLASGDLERARAELQKSKLAAQTEHWWGQTTQVLKQLLMCTFRQGDTAAFIDYSLQLLSPILEEFMSAPERVQTQQSMMLAWRSPEQLGPPFTSSSVLSGHEFSLDRSRPLFTMRAQFDCVYACVKEVVNVNLQLESHFPLPVTMAKLELIFNDDRYNLVIYHRENGIETTPDEQEDGKMFLSLAFDPNTRRDLTVPLRVKGGREFLRYHETRFYLGATENAVVDDSSAAENDSPVESKFLRLSLRCDQAPVVVEANPKPYLLEGRIPVMGKGPGSPSFARRKSMFSTSASALDRSFGDLNLNNGVTPNGEVVEETSNSYAHGTVLAVLQPRAKAKLSIAPNQTLLSGDFRVLSLSLASNEDMLQTVSYKPNCDPAPSSLSLEDAVFFYQQVPGGQLTPVPLDTTLQPRDRMPLPNQEPNTETVFRLIVRCMKSMSLRIGVSISYTTKAGVQVSFEERFELSCHDPFHIATGFLHELPNGVGVNLNAKESYAVVGKPVSLQGSVICSVAEPLHIVSMAFDPMTESNMTKDIVPSGFGATSTPGQENIDAVLNDGDMRNFHLRVVPSQASPFVSLGRVQIRWRRLSSVLTKYAPSEHEEDIVTTWLDIPSVTFVDSPLTISIETPTYALEGTMVSMAIRLRNNENAVHTLRIKPLEDTSEFLISGSSPAPAISSLWLCKLILILDVAYVRPNKRHRGSVAFRRARGENRIGADQDR